MSRKSLWLLLWVMVAGFGMSWIGIQKMILKQDAFRESDQLKEARRLHEELQIEQIGLESGLTQSMRLEATGISLIHFGNSFADPAVSPRTGVGEN